MAVYSFMLYYYVPPAAARGEDRHSDTLIVSLSLQNLSPICVIPSPCCAWNGMGSGGDWCP